ncbi:hypothetical protein ACFS25_13785 [Spirosoma flavum]|uniref:Uncharacterized protein n=2 Tax=Spirosoma flavum TaxID=2048557 RepID=A0ABW6AHA1_9BACT
MSNSISYGQFALKNSEWYEQYTSQVWDASDVSNLLDIFEYKSHQKKDMTSKQLRIVFSKYSPDVFAKLNRESDSLCCLKHEEYRELWNKSHPKVDQSFWDMYCKGLIMLMKVDGTLNDK